MSPNSVPQSNQGSEGSGTAAQHRPGSMATSALIPLVIDGLEAFTDYQVERLLGEGGMGKVYLVLNKMLDRREVLKVVQGDLLHRPGILERFQQEIRNAARLKHTNIVTAYACVQAGGQLAFAMEYVPGADLSQIVADDGPLPVQHSAHYIRQVALGLQHAHEHGMIHRDIKPQNLMVAKDGNRHTVKILDFGLSKVKTGQKVDAALTGAGRMIGTPDYISPEQIHDAAKAAIRSDIYSLGCTLYFLLSGERPFRGQSLYEVLESHVSKQPRDIRVLRPDVPQELADIVNKMMAKGPIHRFQVPAEVAVALMPFVKARAKRVERPLEKSPEGGTAEQSRVSTVETKSPRTPPPIPPASPPGPGPAGTMAGDAWWQTMLPVAGPERQLEPTRQEIAIDGPDRPPTTPAPRRRKLLVAFGATAIVSVTLAILANGIGKVRIKESVAKSAPAGQPVREPDPKPSPFVPLFNQRDLSGLHVVNDQNVEWKVDNGVLVGKGIGNPSPGDISHLFPSDWQYENFHLRVDTMMGEGASTGIKLGVTDADSSSGYRVHIEGTNQLQTDQTQHRTGTIVDSKDAKTVFGLANRAIVAPGKWFVLEIVVIGSRARVMIDGELITDAELDASRLKEKFALYCRPNNALVKFRRIEVSAPTDADTAAVSRSHAASVRAISGNWKIVGHEVRQVDSRPNGRELLFGSRYWGDFDLEAKMMSDSGASVQLLYRTVDLARWSTVLLRNHLAADGRGLVHVESNDPTDGRGMWAHVTSGQRYEMYERRISPVSNLEWHTVRVSLRGDRCTVTVNGKDPHSYNIVRHPQGGIGLRTYNGAARFKDIKVTDPDGKVLWEGLPDLPK